MREFIRHPTDIPIEVSIASETPRDKSAMINLSLGGFCCTSDHPIQPGTLIDIRIPVTTPPYQGQGVISWCDKVYEDEFEIGIHFRDQKNAFLSRMVEQICQIEHYRQEIFATEARELSSEEAAHEWISKYAASFDQPS